MYTQCRQKINLFHILRKYAFVRKERAEGISSLIAEIIAVDDLPISFIIKGQGFQKLMNFLEPNYNIPSEPTIQNRILYQRS